MSLCPAGEAVRDGETEAAAGGGGEAEGGARGHHRETQTGNSFVSELIYLVPPVSKDCKR